MKKRLLLYTTLLLAVFSAFSCKKDEQTTEIKPSIYGLTFDLATFGRPGESFTVEPYGVYVTEGEGIVSYQYKWKVNSDPYSDPMDTFTFGPDGHLHLYGGRGGQLHHHLSGLRPG